MNKVYIVSGKRTPIGSLMGQFADISGIELASITVRQVLRESQFNP